jgi:hypothetical protein
MAKIWAGDMLMGGGSMRLHMRRWGGMARGYGAAAVHGYANGGGAAVAVRGCRSAMGRQLLWCSAALLSIVMMGKSKGIKMWGRR